MLWSTETDVVSVFMTLCPRVDTSWQAKCQEQRLWSSTQQRTLWIWGNKSVCNRVGWIICGRKWQEGSVSRILGLQGSEAGIPMQLFKQVCMRVTSMKTAHCLTYGWRQDWTDTRELGTHCSDPDKWQWEHESGWKSKMERSGELSWLGMGKHGPEGYIWFTAVFVKKVLLEHAHISLFTDVFGYSHLQRQSWLFVTNTKKTAEPKILTIWPFYKNSLLTSNT